MRELSLCVLLVFLIAISCKRFKPVECKIHTYAYRTPTNKYLTEQELDDYKKTALVVLYGIETKDEKICRLQKELDSLKNQ
jgi:hypothetical protein